MSETPKDMSDDELAVKMSAVILADEAYCTPERKFMTACLAEAARRLRLRKHEVFTITDMEISNQNGYDQGYAFAIKEAAAAVDDPFYAKLILDATTEDS